MRSECLCTMYLRETGDSEVDCFRNVSSGTGDVVARAAAAAKAARASGSVIYRRIKKLLKPLVCMLEKCVRTKLPTSQHAPPPTALWAEGGGACCAAV